MADTMRWITGVAAAWAIFVPGWVVAFALLAWGRVGLSKAEVRRAATRTAAASAGLFPLAWAAYAYFAGFNPSPSAPRAVTGGLWAAMLLPVYSALAASVVLEFIVQDAVKRGAPRRRLLTRALSGVAVSILVVSAVAILGAACFLAAGPKAMG